MSNEKKLKEIRCTNCNKRLCDAWIIEGIIEILCKCGVLNKLESKLKKTAKREQKVPQKAE